MVMIGFWPIAASAEAVAVGHHDEQGITLGKSSTGMARRRDHALYLVWRQVFTTAAGVIALASGRLPFALCRKW
jgi:hypothetical protein